MTSRLIQQYEKSTPKNIHTLIIKEFGKENAVIQRKWEQLEKKIEDFQNHKRFILRC